MHSRPIMLLSAAAALALPTLAAAGPSKDRDHDGMPTKWEQRYHLNPNANDAAKDKDKDGLDNLAEYQAHTNPRKADSDGDGVGDAQEDADHDGVENEVESHHGLNPGRKDSDGDGVSDDRETAGSVASFDGTTLVITQLDGTSLTGTVNAQTEIEGCAAPSPTPSPAPTASAARLSRGDDEREGEDDAPPSTPLATTPSPKSGDDHPEPGDDHAPCTSAALVAGAAVHEAKVVNGVFVAVHLSGHDD